jgi:hypothetical protein
MVKKRYKSWGFLLSIMLCSTLAFAQPGRGIPPGNPRNPRSPTIPIDGGISLLAAAGLAYGVRKVYVLKKNENEEH